MSFVQALLADRVPADPAVGRVVREGRRHRHQAHAGAIAGATATCCWPATTATSRPSSRRWSTTAVASACWRSASSPAGAGALTSRGLERLRPRGRRRRVQRPAAAPADHPARGVRPAALPLSADYHAPLARRSSAAGQNIRFVPSVALTSPPDVHQHLAVAEATVRLEPRCAIPA